MMEGLCVASAFCRALQNYTPRSKDHFFKHIQPGMLPRKNLIHDPHRPRRLTLQIPPPPLPPASPSVPPFARLETPEVMARKSIPQMARSPVGLDYYTCKNTELVQFIKARTGTYFPSNTKKSVLISHLEETDRNPGEFRLMDLPPRASSSHLRRDAHLAAESPLRTPDGLRNGAPALLQGGAPRSGEGIVYRQ